MIELIFYNDLNFWGTTKNNSWLYNKQRNNQKEKTEGPAATCFSANSKGKEEQWSVFNK